jgi:stage II sporulation protein D
MDGKRLHVYGSASLVGSRFCRDAGVLHMRRTIALLVLAALSVAGGGAASRGQTAPLSSATFVITGHGWGHGVGMPQWGAYGYAQQGWLYPRILAHYYPSTTLGPAPLARVRVLLKAGVKTVNLSSAVPFTVKDASGTSYPLDPGAVTLTTALKVKVDPANPAKALPGPLVFSPGGQPLKLDRRYRGALQVSVVDGKLQVVNVVGLEAYLYGVVPSEMPHLWAAEALKCQAIVARSYALAVRKTGGSFDLYPDTRSQVYRGADGEQPEASAAVDATAGQVVLYQGKVATTYFYSSSGGRTAAIQDVWPNAKPVPYLVSVADPYDTISPHHNWGPFKFSASTLTKMLKVPGRLVDVQASLNDSGRTTSLTATGTLGEVTVAAGDVRRLLGLRSTWFSLGVLGLSAPAGPAVVYGARARLDGVARGFTPVLLESRVGTAPWSQLGTVALSPDGVVSTVVKPLQATQYRLTSGKVFSSAVTVRVAPLVKLAAATDQTSLRGSVRPAFEGIEVDVQRQSGTTTWKTVARAGLSADGTFQAALTLSPGTYRARVAPGRGFVAGSSAPLRVVTA